MPRPNNSCHKRFIVTRAVSGCSWRNQPVRQGEPIRVLDRRERRQRRRCARFHLIAWAMKLAANVDVRGAWLHCLHHHRRTADHRQIFFQRIEPGAEFASFEFGELCTVD